MDNTLPYKYPKPLMVMIEWLDSQRSDGWQRYDKTDYQVPVVFSVGWLLLNTPDVKVLVSHLSDEDPPQRCSEMAIPACAIRRITALSLPILGRPEGTDATLGVSAPVQDG